MRPIAAPICEGNHVVRLRGSKQAIWPRHEFLRLSAERQLGETSVLNWHSCARPEHVKSFEQSLFSPNALFGLIVVSDMVRNSPVGRRSEEHTSELQSLMRISYAVFCLKTNITTKHVSPYQ